MFSIAEQFISSPSCLESDLHYSVRSPARRCPSANAWDVLRVENLVLEGFSNVFRKEVSARFRSFAFSAPCCNASATFWIGNNNSGTSSLYGGTGNAINIFTEAGGVPGNFVIVPPPGLLPARSPLPRASSLTAAPLIFYSTKVRPLACRPRSSSPRKMALSPAGTRAPTSPRVPRRLPSTLSSKSTIQKKAVPTAPSTKAQPPEKSMATNFFTSRTSVLRESKFMTPRSSA